MPRRTVDMVQEFCRAFSLTHLIAVTPRVPSAKICLHRIQCLTEETGELGLALGNEDLVEVIDALTDIQYLLDGTYLACGMHDLKNYENNMSDWLFSDEHLQVPCVPDAESGLHIMRRLLHATERLAQAFEQGDVRDVYRDLEWFTRLLDDTYENCGMADIKQDAFEEVHRTNMAKLGPDGKPSFDKSGRLLKPKGWVRPKLAWLVKPQDDFL